MLIFIKNISDVEIEPVIEYHKKKLSLRIFGAQSRLRNLKFKDDFEINNQVINQ
jgi:hypothetical protein